MHSTSLFLLLLFMTNSFQVMSAMQSVATPSNKAPIDEPAQPIYYIEGPDHKNLIIDRPLSKLCTTLDHIVSEYPDSYGTDKNPYQLSDQIQPQAFKTWLSCLKQIAAHPDGYQQMLHKQLTCTSDQQLVDTLSTAHYFELNPTQVSSLVQSSPIFARDVIERAAIDEFFKRFAKNRPALKQLDIPTALQTRLRAYAAQRLSNIRHLYLMADMRGLFAEPNINHEPVYSVCYSPDSNCLISRTRKYVGIHSLRSESPVSSFINEECTANNNRLSYRPSNVHRLNYTPNGNHLAASLYWNGIAIINVDSKQILQKLWLSTYSYFRAFAYSPSGDYLAVGRNDGNISLFDTDRYLVAKDLTISQHNINALCFHPHHDLLYSCDYKGGLFSCPLESGTVTVFDSPKLPYAATTLMISPDGALLATAQKDLDGITLWDAKQHTAIKQLVSGFRVPRVLWHPMGNYLAALTHIDDCSKVVLYDIRMDKELYCLFSAQAINDIAFNGEGSELAVAANSLIVRCNVNQPPKNIDTACMLEGFLEDKINSQNETEI